MQRRTFIGYSGCMLAVGIAGCSDGGSSDGEGSSPLEESGQISGEGDITHNIDVSSGETLRIEVDNEAGMVTIVTIYDSEDERVHEGQVETEKTVTYTAEESSVHTVFISTDNDTSYEIYVDSE